WQGQWEKRWHPPREEWVVSRLICYDPRHRLILADLEAAQMTKLLKAQPDQMEEMQKRKRNIFQDIIIKESAAELKAVDEFQFQPCS
ncbi:MAG: hypothetical protein ACLFQ0_08655, partial [Cyclobacteriaceae bacterium]